MSGFDNGTMQGGVFAQAQQFGAILRGSGVPAPSAGVVGSVYIDIVTWWLYAKRSNDRTNGWGNWIFRVPDDYQATLRWFSASQPLDSVGADGDYCLMWGGYPNYGTQPSIIGPKAAGVWPTALVEPVADSNPLATADNVHNI